MRRLNRLLVLIVIGSLITYGMYLGHLAQLSYKGYCHAAGKYLTDDEKIKIALFDLLKKYPPPVIQTPASYGWARDTPKNPIYYHDVNSFLSLNPDCCKIKPAEAYTEGASITLIDNIFGAATNVIEVNYLVRFKDNDNMEQSIKTLDYLHITNCGTPGQPWSPY
jgi:hypothetical protein